MNWTPGAIKSLAEKYGGIAILAEIMRVTPHSIQNMIYGSKSPSIGSGIALLNLIEVLEETFTSEEIATVVDKLRKKNSKTPIRIIKNKREY